MPARVLLIDNYDSFTWNLVQRIGEVDASADVIVRRNDAVTLDEAERLRPTHIVISPGPCAPDDAGVSVAIVERFGGRVPLLGVCLGHQCIGAAHGMTVAQHGRLVHGKTSEVRHDGAGIFAGLPEVFAAARYHSLVVLPDSVPGGWAVTATTRDVLADGTEAEVVMGLRRVGRPGEAPLEGVQFHPESYLTTEGPRMLANFLAMRASVRGVRGRAAV